jgi:drug/metabolite transporter (DMT)-like permease
MLPSFLTTLLFSLSVIFAARSAHVLGPGVANLGRITLATGLLALWAHLFGSGTRGPGFPWFFLSGIIGFGLGDLALFGALPRIGPRLAILLTQCLAAPFAAFVEWAWLGTQLRGVELVCAGAILAGVAVALAPDRGLVVARGAFWVGIGLGVGSAVGQALGAVLSRKANLVGNLAGVEIDGGTAAYQRILGGALMTVIAVALLRKRKSAPHDDAPGRWRRGWPLVVGNALAGPAIGVGCYQWALKTTPSGIVLPIVATSPLVTLMMAWMLSGERPTRRAVVGGVIAVAGAAALSRVQAL